MLRGCLRRTSASGERVVLRSPRDGWGRSWRKGQCGWDRQSKCCFAERGRMGRDKASPQEVPGWLACFAC